jgi:hypothetical protein
MRPTSPVLNGLRQYCSPSVWSSLGIATPKQPSLAALEIEAEEHRVRAHTVWTVKPPLSTLLRM